MSSTPGPSTPRKRKGSAYDNESDQATAAFASLATSSPKSPSKNNAVRKGKFKRPTIFTEDYCNYQASLAQERQEKLDADLARHFKEYQEAGGDLEYSEWCSDKELAQKLIGQSSACESWATSLRNQSKRLKVAHDKNPYQVGFFELFAEAPSGFDMKSQSESRGESQNIFRREMVKVYNAEQPGKKGRIWEPILGEYIHFKDVNAAHLYPWKSRRHMKSIFSSDDDLFSPRNGLLLYKPIEKALELGYITIVPCIPIDGEIGSHPVLDNELLRRWEQAETKEFMVWVLKDDGLVDELDFTWRSDGIEKIKHLHRRQLTWQSNFRPAARYVWWAHLNSVLRCSLWQQGFKFKQGSTGKLSWAVEVNNATKFWGTKGRYIKKNALWTFVEHLGNTLDDDVAETMKANALESGEPEIDDVSALAATHERVIEGDGYQVDSDKE